MASTIRVDTLQDAGANEYFASDGSGVFTGSLTNKPAFEAYLNANQTPTDATDTKITFDTEVFDTDSAYDNSSNYRFTVPLAGKYMVYCAVLFGSSSETLDTANLYIYKNGAVHTRLQMRSAANEANAYTITENKIMDLAANDYIEIYGHNDVSSGTPNFGGVSSGRIQSRFGAYKLVGV